MSTVVTTELVVHTLEVASTALAVIQDKQTQVVTAGIQGPPGIGIPSGGAAGNFLKKMSIGADDCAWASAPVTSVASRTGDISLSASDISGLGALATLNLNSANTWTAQQILEFDNIGVAASDTKGIALINNTATTVSNTQQWSPELRWRGHGWKVNSPATDQSVDFRQYVQTVSGSTAAVGKLVTEVSNAGASYVQLMSLQSSSNPANSQLNIPGSLIAGNSVVGNTGSFSTLVGTLIEGTELNIGGGAAIINSDGSANFATDFFTIDANGNAVINGGAISLSDDGSGVLANGSITFDSVGEFYAQNIYAANTFNSDGGQISSGGSGDLTAYSFNGQQFYLNGNLTAQWLDDGSGGMYFNGPDVNFGNDYSDSQRFWMGQDGQDVVCDFSLRGGMYAAIGDTQFSSLGGRLRVFGGLGYSVFDGNVGFGGQNNPAYAVDVTGDVNVTGDFYINGSPIAGVITTSDNSLSVSGSDIAINAGHTNTWSATQTFQGSVSFNQNVTLAPAGGLVSLGTATNFVLSSLTGTKWATATNQKQAWWNATPIVQPTTSVASATFVANSGTAVNSASTFDGYTIAQVVKALRNMGKLA